MPFPADQDGQCGIPAGTDAGDQLRQRQVHFRGDFFRGTQNAHGERMLNRALRQRDKPAPILEVIPEQDAAINSPGDEFALIAILPGIGHADGRPYLDIAEMTDALQTIEHKSPFRLQLRLVTQLLQLTAGTPLRERTGRVNAVRPWLTQLNNARAAIILRNARHFHLQEIAGDAVGDKQGEPARACDAVTADGQCFHRHRETLPHWRNFRDWLIVRHSKKESNRLSNESTKAQQHQHNKREGILRYSTRFMSLCLCAFVLPRSSGTSSTRSGSPQG